MKETHTMEKALAGMVRAVGFLILFIALAAPGALLVGFPVMLALGVLHNDFSPAVPALGYWATVLAVWGTGALVGHLRSSRKAA
jgi:hypothetical protein